MKKTFLILLILLSFISKSQSLDTIQQFNYKKHFELIVKESKKRGSNYLYETQLQKYNNNESQTNLEVLALLIGFTESKNYDPYADIFLDKTIYDLNEEKKFDEAIAQGKAILAQKPFIIPILREMAYAYSQKGENEKAEQYMIRTGKIYNAMFYSSKSTGININEAMFALGPKDGQYFIKYFIEAPLGDMGSGSDENGYFIDILSTTFKNKEAIFNFNIDHAMKKMREKMKKK
ncbi:DUF4919 domain-containing protein [Flavobacterium sp. Sd200]|uniref:DUF4919 domain-containing protein n=1 Tax=Flavobacterium sp. Sd200 TaxID=2692211 RepID=UPI0013711D47|nr:DUF4919 domain-containing protein [Flavobacterium sp. Sd200]MXN92973.1 DUF4919 domain-containing protein [Flavobacterium sp. Sd200]